MYRDSREVNDPDDPFLRLVTRLQCEAACASGGGPTLVSSDSRHNILGCLWGLLCLGEQLEDEKFGHLKSKTASLFLRDFLLSHQATVFSEGVT